MTAGSMFLVWIGDLISEKNIGNGISLLIFASIISAVPQVLQNAIVTFDQTQILNIILFAVISIITVVAIVFITEGQRNIPVSYARASMGGNRMSGGVSTYLPIRVNQAGVIPIIFAISLVLFPPLVAQFFVNARSTLVANIADWVIVTFQNQLLYGVMYFVLVFSGLIRLQKICRSKVDSFRVFDLV